jgi:predicted DNA-binding transcriptional regulator YafY
VLHRDSVYCVGYHLDRREIRTFVLDRMRDTQPQVTERFAIPRDFDIEDYFQGEFGIWRAKEKRKVIVDFDDHAAEYVKMRKVHQSQKLANLVGGGVRLTMTVGNLNQVTSWVLEWGPHAVVREPEELVERVRAELRGALANYETPSPGPSARKRTAKSAVPRKRAPKR